ncbi:MAG: phage portal protein [Clostridia bacterium]|nr:phage portal protein [Clostridia bacterium]
MKTILTYQDFLEERDRAGFLRRLIAEHEADAMVKTARTADLYDRQRNRTICESVRRIYTLAGMPVKDPTAGSQRIASNFFSRLNTQRAAYLLGNGAGFTDPETKARLGADFDTRLMQAGRLALIHGVSFLFFNVDRVHVFPLTEFAPLWDEETGRLRAGLRYWQLAADKPLCAVLYEEEGYTHCRWEKGGAQLASRQPYRTRVLTVPAEEGSEVLGGENYGALPVVPLWGSRLHQSTLVGMRQAIDSYDLIRSGLANDLNDCAEIYWLLENYGGMTDAELSRFRDRLKLMHIAALDTGGEGRVTPYTQEIPHAARQAYLAMLRAGIYEDFGALDVSALSAGTRTATEIQAAYQPLDEQADDFEYQVIECVQQLLSLLGICDTPLFTRNRIANQMEQVRTVMLEAPVLDRQTLLCKLPNLTPEEVRAVLERTGEEKKKEERHG